VIGLPIAAGRTFSYPARPKGREAIQLPHKIHVISYVVHCIRNACQYRAAQKTWPIRTGYEPKRGVIATYRLHNEKIKILEIYYRKYLLQGA
jgi:hypothetical protein